LKKEVSRLRAERDILKKAAVGSTGQCNGSFERSSRRFELGRKHSQTHTLNRKNALFAGHDEGGRTWHH